MKCPQCNSTKILDNHHIAAVSNITQHHIRTHHPLMALISFSVYALKSTGIIDSISRNIFNHDPNLRKKHLCGECEYKF